MFQLTTYRAPSMITSSVPLEDHYNICAGCNIAKASNGICAC